MWMMLQVEKPDDYVVATGRTHSVREFVEAAFKVVNLTPEPHVKHSPAFNRPKDPAHLVGSPEKIRTLLGWQPRGSFEDLVREMVEAELAAVDSEKTAGTLNNE
jgi:GDPmannose 4,6-dehydratase